MRYHEEVDIRILIDRLRLINDGIKQMNKPYSQWTTLEIWQYAFPALTYMGELLQILDKEDDYTHSGHRDNYEQQGECL